MQAGGAEEGPNGKRGGGKGLGACQPEPVGELCSWAVLGIELIVLVGVDGEEGEEDKRGAQWVCPVVLPPRA